MKRQFSINQLAYLHTPQTPKGKSHKFMHFWHGPFLITALKLPNAQIVRPGARRTQPFWVHVNRLKPCHVPAAETGPEPVPKISAAPPVSADDDRCSNQPPKDAIEEPAATASTSCSERTPHNLRLNPKPKKHVFCVSGALFDGLSQVPSSFSSSNSVQIQRGCGVSTRARGGRGGGAGAAPARGGGVAPARLRRGSYRRY